MVKPWKYLGQIPPKSLLEELGEEVGVISMNNLDFIETMRDTYQKGIVHKGSYYNYNGVMFKCISHPDHLRGYRFSSVMGTNRSPLNPFYYDLYNMLGSSRGYRVLDWNKKDFDQHNWNFWDPFEHFVYS